jgi:hypothetical protein
LRRLTVVCALIALFAGGCAASNGESSPKQRLSAALAGLENSPGLFEEITLQSTPASLQALAAQHGDGLSTGDAEKILHSSLRIFTRLPDGEEQGASRVLVNVAGSDDIELRAVAKTLYVRIDARHLLETLGEDPDAMEQLAGQGYPVIGADFLQPLLAGKWVALRGLGSALGGGEVQPPAAEQKRMVEELSRSLRRSATVRSAGEEDAGEHLVVSISLRDAYRSLLEATSGLSRGLPSGELPPEADVPDRQIALDVWVDDGHLTRVEFDFLQLRSLPGTELPSGVSRLALRIDVAEFTGAISIPQESSPVDLGEILGAMVGGFGASAKAGGLRPYGGAGGELCEQLKGQPREVTEQFAEQCPQLVR